MNSYFSSVLKNLTLLTALKFGLLVHISLSCSIGEHYVPQCADFSRADAVILGRVTKVEKNFAGSDDGYWRRVHFKVLSNFKGAIQSSFTTLTPPWEAACGLNVKAGQRWIVYATFDKDQGAFVSTKGSKYSKKEDIEYIDFLNRASRHELDTEISGRLDPFGGYPTYNFSGVRVSLDNSRDSVTTVTDDQGTFKFSSLQPGDYRVRLSFDYFATFLWIYEDIEYNVNQHEPTVVEYDIRLAQGECDYRYLEVSRPATR
jgi:hypothetical protein